VGAGCEAQRRSFDFCARSGFLACFCEFSLRCSPPLSPRPRAHDAQARRIFECIDQAHTNHISYTEFLAASLSRRLWHSRERIKDAFQRLDMDGTGYITQVRRGGGGGGGVCGWAVASVAGPGWRGRGTPRG
jgi:hypothetical protein